MASQGEALESTRPSPATGDQASVPKSWGRNKFGPQRGPWTDEDWNGWWGDDPVFHTPVFVLTHHPRPTIEMKGGTTFHFIDATPVEALRLAQEAAGELDVRIGGGPSDSSSVPRRRSDRPHAHCDRADCPGTRSTTLGGTRRAGSPLQY